MIVHDFCDDGHEKIQYHSHAIAKSGRLHQSQVIHAIQVARSRRTLDVDDVDGNLWPRAPYLRLPLGKPWVCHGKSPSWMGKRENSHHFDWASFQVRKLEEITRGYVWGNWRGIWATIAGESKHLKGIQLCECPWSFLWFDWKLR